MKQISSLQLVKKLAKKRKQLFPFDVSMEITSRCNLDCRFCLLGEKKNSAPDMPLERVFQIVDQLKEEGVMRLLVTGGEVFLREDYMKIYKYLKKKGFLVRIQTNGTLITDEVAEMLKKWPPTELRISMVAGSPQGYKKVAGNSEGFNKVINSIKILKQNSIKFYIFYPLINLNADELINVKKKAEQWGVLFQLSSRLTCTQDGKSTKEFKILPQQLERIRKYDKEFSRWIDFDKRMLNITKKCRRCIHITNNCQLQMCPIVSDIGVFDLNYISIKEALNKALNSKILINCPTV